MFIFSIPLHFIPGLLYHERCDCPESDHTRWVSEMKCPQSYTQISRDLEPFPQIDLTKMKEDAIREFGTHHALCHYSVVDNKVFLLLNLKKFKDPLSNCISLKRFGWSNNRKFDLSFVLKWMWKEFQFPEKRQIHQKNMIGKN